MTKEEIVKAIGELVALSNKMAAAATNGEWSKVRNVANRIEPTAQKVAYSAMKLSEGLEE